jgi:excisionase family DNA binding protein
VTKLLTRAEVAGLLRVSLRSVDRLCQRGELRPVKVLSAVRFRLEDVEALIESQRRAGRST